MCNERCSLHTTIKSKVNITGKLGYGIENIGSTTNYNNLENKPKINNIELKDNKTSKDLNLQDKMKQFTNIELESIFGDL